MWTLDLSINYYSVFLPQKMVDLMSDSGMRGGPGDNETSMTSTHLSSTSYLRVSLCPSP